MSVFHRALWPVYRLADGLVKAVLASPLHFLLSWQFLVLEFTGVKTGRRYRVGLNYIRRGTALHCMSDRRRTWWRNLRSGGEVRVLWLGRWRPARATAEEHNLLAIASGLCERELLRRLLYRARPEGSVLISIEPHVTEAGLPRPSRPDV